jgi:hypothetical protein
MVPSLKELRRDVLAACDRGKGTRVVTFHFPCRESWVRRVKQERRELGQIRLVLTRRRVPQRENDRDKIVELITKRPKMTLPEWKDALQTPLSRQTRCTALKRRRLTLKKSPESH